MIVESVYSFCDAMEQINLPDSQYHRVYFGSTFCDRYFINTSRDLWMKGYQLAQSSGAKVTLVIPIPVQSLLRTMKEKLEWLFSLFQDTLDEIVVNDYAMLSWIGTCYPSYTLWLGRLLVKDTRDPRYIMDQQTCKLLDHIKNGDLYGFPISGVELDVFAPLVLEDPMDITLAFHCPYCYVSTGRLCEIGSIGEEPKNKFHPTSDCTRQCVHTWLWYENSEATLLKHGRAIYSTFPLENVFVTLPTKTKVRLINDGFTSKNTSHREA